MGRCAENDERADLSGSSFSMGGREEVDHGHFCFVGLNRPGEESFEDFWKRIRKIEPFEALISLRRAGAASFANHPVRYWISNGKFSTNMYSGLPFDLGVAGLLDGLNINEGGERALRLWSLMLDHGYRIAATGGADFALDHPRSWLPGLSRLYVRCPQGLTEGCISKAIQAGQTVVSTGPLLAPAIDQDLPPGSTVTSGRSHRIVARAWARNGQPDELERLELWAHGEVIETRGLNGDSRAQTEASFNWTPKGDYDWVAVRVIAKSGWAMSSAFYAASTAWTRPCPIESKVSLTLAETPGRQLQGAMVEIWDNNPEAPGSEVLGRHPVPASLSLAFTAPPTATLRVRLPDGGQKDVRLYDASGIHPLMEKLAQGEERDEPLLRWQTYEEVRQMCAKVTVRVTF